VGSEGLFDDMGGRFTARLRHHQTLTHTSPGGGRGESISVRSRLGVLEARFDLEVLDRLHEPCFVAIERVLGGIHTRGGGDAGKAYLVYEVTGVSPTHYQMLAMNTALPTVIRKEYLNTIYEGWGVSDETWVDVHCAPTGYMVVEDGGRPVFTRSSLVPLAGAPAHLLSREATRSFLCVEGGVPIGTILGFDIELTVDIHSLVKYHAGVFGFTGTGKSNLTSLIVRQSLDAWGGDGTVVVFDVAGEYAVNLADMLATGGILYSPEELGDVDSLLESQTLPETLESKISAEQLRAWAGGLVDDGRVRPLQLGDEGGGGITLGFLLDTLRGYKDDRKTGAVQAAVLIERIRVIASEGGLELDVPVESLPAEARGELSEAISQTLGGLNDRSSLYTDLSAVLSVLEGGGGRAQGVDGGSGANTPESVALQAVSKDAPPLIIVYTPEPRDARVASSRFISRLLYLKKHGYRRRVGVVLDEAQEFIPYDTRRDDLTLQSSLAVESLLRQGRKYRAHCVLATQRVAHLNTNALQQLHSYFVSTMPRYYDRLVVAEAFSLNYEVLERTTELDTGQWLFVSFKSTKQRNVPVFIQTPNNEDKVAEWFRMVSS
jgi:hypothetical protein